MEISLLHGVAVPTSPILELRGGELLELPHGGKCSARGVSVCECASECVLRVCFPSQRVRFKIVFVFFLCLWGPLSYAGVRVAKGWRKGLRWHKAGVSLV